MKKQTRRGRVYFVGAGPGDPGLLTVAAVNVLSRADCVVYAGSLVHPDILTHAAGHARLVDSASLDLKEITDLLISEVRLGRTVVRLHSGDPSLYGAIAEQTAVLDKHGVAWEIIPGVSSVFAAAAALGIEYTLPERTQTLILTRRAGRTPVPERESLAALAAHRSSMAIFLSADMIADVVRDLIGGGYPAKTPAAVVYRASWADQKIISGTLETITSGCRRAGINRQALIIVGAAVRRKTAATSRLYASDFTHGYRGMNEQRAGTAVVAVTRRGAQTGRRILNAIDDAVLHIPEKYRPVKSNPRIFCYQDLQQLVRGEFPKRQALVLIMATGIAVRMIAPLLRSKWDDPAVVSMDDSGRNVISLLSGHWGGANELASRLALVLGSNPVITTESDVMGYPSLDLLAKALTDGGQPGDPDRIKHMQALLVDGKDIALYPKELRHFPGMAGNPSLHFYDTADDALAAACAAVVIASPFRHHSMGGKRRCLQIVPRSIVLGVGCHAGITEQEIATGVRHVCKKLRLHPESIAAICTIDRRKDEPGLVEFCRKRTIALRTFSTRRLQRIRGLSPASPHVERALSIPGVAEPCAIVGAEGGSLILKKEKTGGMTIAVAQKTLRQIFDESEVRDD